MKKVLFLALLISVAVGSMSSTRRFTNANVVTTNNVGGSYRAVFILNGVETNFAFLSSGSKTYTAAIAPGTYQLGVAPNGGSSAIHTFSWSCGPDNGSTSGTSALFNNVTVYSGGTITVSIN